MDLKEKIESAYPIGARVKWSGQYYGAYMEGEGEIIGYKFSPISLKVYYVVVAPDNEGEKWFSVSNENGEFCPSKEIEII